VRNVYCGTVLAGKTLDKAAVEKSIQLQMGGAPARAPRSTRSRTSRPRPMASPRLISNPPAASASSPSRASTRCILSRQLTKCSYPQIGRMFGDRDHTTVLFAYRKISAMIAGNEGMAEELRQLEQRIMADPRNSR
jgi:hypothetical protein